MGQFNLDSFSVDQNGNVTCGSIIAGAATFSGVVVSGPRTRTRAAKTAAYTITASNDLIAYTAIAAARVVTLPAANAVAAGQVFSVKDEAGAANAFNLTITPAGTDTIDGAASLVISANYGKATFYSDGVSKWFTL